MLREPRFVTEFQCLSSVSQAWREQPPWSGPVLAPPAWWPAWPPGSHPLPGPRPVWRLAPPPCPCRPPLRPRPAPRRPLLRPPPRQRSGPLAPAPRPASSRCRPEGGTSPRHCRHTPRTNRAQAPRGELASETWAATYTPGFPDPRSKTLEGARPFHPVRGARADRSPVHAATCARAITRAAERGIWRACCSPLTRGRAARSVLEPLSEELNSKRRF